MRWFFIAAILILSLSSLTACATASPATPIPPVAPTETPGPTISVPTSTGVPATSVVGTNTSTPVQTLAATATSESTVPPPSATPFPSPSPAPVLPIPTASAVPPTPVAIPPNGSLTVTLADAGKTINLKVGGGFLLALGETFDWNVTIADQSIVSRQVNIAVIRGAQGVYNAHKAGQTTLRAVGDPFCRATNPPCEQPSRLVVITIVVT